MDKDGWVLKEEPKCCDQEAGRGCCVDKNNLCFPQRPSKVVAKESITLHEVSKQSKRNRRRALRRLLIFSSPPCSAHPTSWIGPREHGSKAPGFPEAAPSCGKVHPPVSFGPFPCYKKSDLDFQSSSVPSSCQNRYRMFYSFPQILLGATFKNDEISPSQCKEQLSAPIH